MHNVITFMLTVAVMMSIVLTVGDNLLSTFSDVTGAWTVMLERVELAEKTKVGGPVGLSMSASSTVEITLSNQGDVSLARFDDWDVIFEIQGSPGFDVAYLAYSTSTPPTTNMWAVQGIFANAASSTPEVADPGVLNPGEEMVVVANPSPSVVANTYDRATFVTPNGVVAKVIFKVTP